MAMWYSDSHVFAALLWFIGLYNAAFAVEYRSANRVPPQAGVTSPALVQTIRSVHPVVTCVRFLATAHWDQLVDLVLYVFAVAMRWV